MAKTIQIERRKRGFFGWIFLILFWGFNLFMIAVLGIVLGFWGGTETPVTEVEKAAHGLGMAIGFSMTLSIWASGVIVLGGMAFATRGKKIIETVQLVDNIPAAKPDIAGTGKWSPQKRK